MKLLLIDDDEVDRRMVMRLLSGIDPPPNIVQATTAQEGLKIFRTGGFDAVFLDYYLPDMTAFDAIPVLMEYSVSQAAIIILTGKDDDALALQCLEAGAQDFLLKQEVNAQRLLRTLVHARVLHALQDKISESREKYRFLAQNDQLTGLPNRHFFDESLASEIARCGDLPISLLLLDIDNFKRVNDIRGHDVGDVLIREVAARLRHLVPPGQIVCRIGGDEFAIIASDGGDEATALDIAERIKATFAEPFNIGDVELEVSSSVGIAVALRGATTAAQLLKSADLAMYKAKRDGRNRIQLFTQDLQREAVRRDEIERDLRSAVVFDQLTMFYQPLFCTSDREICGAEALIRWRHPQHGLLPPSAFLDIAEEFGLLARIDNWSRRTAFWQLSDWRARGLVRDGFRMNFNVSASALDQPGLDVALQLDCAAVGLPPTALELEVTEDVLVANFKKTNALLNRIKDCGVSIAIDDFGTGYSSMAYLKNLPASTIKIDRSFLFEVPENESYCRVLNAMIGMAKNLGLRVLVEGIETQEQMELCLDYGADVLQGYFFSHPLSADEFERRFLKLPVIST